MAFTDWLIPHLDQWAAIISGEDSAGTAIPPRQVVGNTLTISQTPTITAGAYSANDACGGLLTFANAARVSGGKGVIQSVVIIDDDLEDSELDLVLFDRTFTAMADNAAWSPSDADNQNCIGHITIGAEKYCDGDDNSIATVVNCGLAFTLSGTSMFGQLVIRDGNTYTATDDLTVKIVILRD